jgi:N-methylhydantoinase B/oxoprolinase/acetone carboxylase alpha subunit
MPVTQSAGQWRGGAPGRLCEVIRHPGSPGERLHGKIGLPTLQSSEVIRITSSAGSGFGAPLMRDPAAVSTQLGADRICPTPLRSALAIEAMQERPNQRHKPLALVCHQMQSANQPVTPAALKQALAAGRDTLRGRPLAQGA